MKDERKDDAVHFMAYCDFINIGHQFFWPSCLVDLLNLEIDAHEYL